MDKLMVEYVATAIADSRNESIDPMLPRTDVCIPPDDSDRVAARRAIQAVREWEKRNG